MWFGFVYVIVVIALKSEVVIYKVEEHDLVVAFVLTVQKKPIQFMEKHILKFILFGYLWKIAVLTIRLKDLETMVAGAFVYVMNGRMIFNHFMIMYHNFHTLGKMDIP